MQLSFFQIRFRYLVLLMAALMLADGLITQFLVGAGIATEANPFMQKLLASGDLIPFKIAGALLSALLMVLLYQRRPRLAIIATWCFITLYTGIVCWNIGIVTLGLLG